MKAQTSPKLSRYTNGYFSAQIETGAFKLKHLYTTKQRNSKKRLITFYYIIITDRIQRVSFFEEKEQ